MYENAHSLVLFVFIQWQKYTCKKQLKLVLILPPPFLCLPPFHSISLLLYLPHFISPHLSLSNYSFYFFPLPQHLVPISPIAWLAFMLSDGRLGASEAWRRLINRGSTDIYWQLKLTSHKVSTALFS